MVLRTLLAALLAAALAVAGCGGDDSSSDKGSDSGSASTTSSETQTQTETQAETTAADPAADAEKQEEVKAQGTMQAFVQSLGEGDELVFCGIVTKRFLRKITKGKVSDPGKCVLALKGKKFATKALKGSKPIDAEVDGNVAVGRIQLRNGKISQIVMRKPEDRWLVDKVSG